MLKKEGNSVTIPESLFRFLMAEYLRYLPFNEAAYLRTNPDVDIAIHKGDIPSGKDHFAVSGYFEERDTGGSEFDEKWYLKHNEDVAASVRKGEWNSARDHWMMVGRAEFRAPCREQVALYDAWRAHLTGE